MNTRRIRMDVLNPCPRCGKRFDIGGCMTFVDSFLTELHGGKCPDCGTQVVNQVEAGWQPQVWETAATLADIRAIRIDALSLSIRTQKALKQLGILDVGDLLDSSETRIKRGFAVSEPILREVRQLLAEKGLSVAKE